MGRAKKAVKAVVLPAMRGYRALLYGIAV
jgi:hypothetical protein